MPYIKKDRRVDIVNGEIPKNAGELNFWITENLRIYIAMKGESHV